MLNSIVLRKASVGTTSRLRSIDNLHKVYGELTELEYVLVRLEAREYAGTIHTISGAGHEEHRRLSVCAWRHAVRRLTRSRCLEHFFEPQIGP